MTHSLFPPILGEQTVLIYLPAGFESELVIHHHDLGLFQLDLVFGLHAMPTIQDGDTLAIVPIVFF